MILILLFILIIISLVDAFILRLILKNKFLIEASYKKSLLSSVAIKMVILLSILVMINNDGYLVIIISVLLGPLVGWFIFKKYFKISAAKSFIVLIYYFVFVLLISAIPYLIRFSRELYLQHFYQSSISEVCGGRAAYKGLCEPSLICQYYSCGDSGCLALPSCGEKMSKFNN